MDDDNINSYSDNTTPTYQDIEDIIYKYVKEKSKVKEILKWATDKASKFYIRNIINTKSNIEETKFEPRNNIGIEYSKDSKNKLSYRNKPLIETNKDYSDICNLIRTTNGTEKEILRYILFGIKCVQKNVEFNIDDIRDINYEEYFNVLDKKYNLPCPECKSKNTIPVMIQTRAADEPPLVMHSCRDCKKNFKPPKFRAVEK
ncbi:DNA-dependent RNA polymerase subunit [Goatpox virus]|nr:RNA polymerase subunit 30 kD [Goatpox virus Oman/84]ADG65242.1 RNA polymerase subunit 30 kD [Goatpox virus India/83]ADG65255.1 RNA polymerase subunit 30 kD [Goatpox virus Bangladesh/86]AFH53910.1 RNA polymerase subunit 30 kD [Goatpox virus]AGZ95350.1 RNA polymerase subunit [Goatpox virus FZ]WDY86307.1 RNA polymerase subunit 30 kD [Sheeppox virus]